MMVSSAETMSSLPFCYRMIRRSGNRFADKIMRHFKASAGLDAKPVPTFADRAWTSLHIGGDLHLGHLVGVGDRAALRARRRLLQLVDDFHARDHLADHRVLAIEERSIGEADEELRIG